MSRRRTHAKLNWVALAAGAVAYAALHLLLSAVPLSLPFGAWTLDLRPGLVVPLAAGLLGGPLVGALVGGLGRLGGDLLGGAGVNAAGLVYSALVGLIAGGGYRPRANFRTLQALGWAMLWVLIAAIGAGLGATLLVEVVLLGAYPLAEGWTRAVSEALSGVVAGGLLMPGVLLVASLRK